MSARNAYEAMHQRFPGNLRRIEVLQNVARRLHREIRQVNENIRIHRGNMDGHANRYFYYDAVARRLDQPRYWRARMDLTNEIVTRNRMMRELRRIRDLVNRLRGRN